MNKKDLWKSGVLIIAIIILSGCGTDNQVETNNQYSDNVLHKLEYNNPDLLVDLDAGFKAVPMPMDFDGDGDYDLLISESGCYAESGIFYLKILQEMLISRYFGEDQKFRLSADVWVTTEVILKFQKWMGISVF